MEIGTTYFHLDGKANNFVYRVLNHIAQMQEKYTILNKFQLRLKQLSKQDIEGLQQFTRDLKSHRKA